MSDQIATKELAKGIVGQAERVDNPTLEQAQALRLQETFQEKGARAALTAEAVSSVDKNKINAARESLVSGDYDRDTFSQKVDAEGKKIRSGDNANLDKEFGATTDKINLLLEKGWTGLTDAEKGVLRVDIETALRKNAVMSDVLDESDNKDAIIDKIASNPKFLIHAESLLSSAIDPENLPKSIDSELVEKVRKARSEFLKKEEEHKQKKKEERDLRKTYTEEWEGSGSKKTELDGFGSDLDDRIGDLRRRIGADEDRLNETRKDSRARTTVGERDAARTEADSIESSLKRQRDELAGLERDAKRRDELRSEKDTQQENLDKLTQELGTLKISMDDLERLSLAEVAEFDLANNQRQALERGYVGDLDSIITKAASETIKDMVGDAAEIEQESMQQAIKDAKEGAIKSLREDLKERYYKVERKAFLGFIRKRSEKVHNAEHIASDWNTLLHKGPEGLLESRLLEMSEYQDPTDNSRLNEEGLRVLKSSDIKNIQEEFVEVLLQNKLQSSKITQSEAEILDSSDLGEKVLEAAVNRNPDAQELVKNLRDAGVMQGGPVEFFRNQPKWRQVLFGVLSLGTLAAAWKFGAPAAVASAIK